MLHMRRISLLGGLSSGLLHLMPLVLRLSWRLCGLLLRLRCLMLLMLGRRLLLRLWCLMLMLGCRRLSCCFLGHRLTGGLNCMTFVSITHRRIMLH